MNIFQGQVAQLKRSPYQGLHFGDREQLEIIGKVTVKGRTKQVARCHKCLADPELFNTGLFVTTITHLRNLRMPCGCGGSPRWNEWQWKLRVARQAEKLGYGFNGWGDSFNGNLTRFELNCRKHGSWTSTVSNFFRPR